MSSGMRTSMRSAMRSPMRAAVRSPHHDGICGPRDSLGGTVWQSASKARHGAICPSPGGMTWQHLEAAFRSNYIVLGKEVKEKGEKKWASVSISLIVDKEYS